MPVCSVHSFHRSASDVISEARLRFKTVSTRGSTAYFIMSNSANDMGRSVKLPNPRARKSEWTRTLVLPLPERPRRKTTWGGRFVSETFLFTSEMFRYAQYRYGMIVIKLKSNGIRCCFTEQGGKDWTNSQTNHTQTSGLKSKRGRPKPLISSLLSISFNCMIGSYTNCSFCELPASLTAWSKAFLSLRIMLWVMIKHKLTDGNSATHKGCAVEVKLRQNPPS